ncbi:MAG: nickel-dependent lactate racemase [Sphaerochaeta sp.]|jgi:nickel-dependent lactate racemase|nr:nickel-dependent lactate racemase [Sphaerochaeta sp.]
MQVPNPLNTSTMDLLLPDNTVIYGMQAPAALANPAKAVAEALEHPIASESLRTIAAKKRASNADANAVIVISDNTRPVPYKGEGNILVPVIQILFEVGYQKENILVLIATGTHRPMTEDEIEKIIDPWVFEHGVKVENHDCLDQDDLTFLGKTERGSEVRINRRYVNADLKILTGLVESHFMAGVSGGRKSICPGLISEQGTFLFHGADLMGHRESRDLNLAGNPVHEESTAFARMAGSDFIINVTLDHAFAITGVYAGDMEAAFIKAYEMVKGYARIPIQAEADIVITHAGFVGINHYQSAKAAFAAIGAVKKDGYLISIANFTDKKDIIGSVMYKTVVALLALSSGEQLTTLLHSPDWPFLPDQWQVQKWASVFEKIPLDHYYHWAPQLDKGSAAGLPGKSIADLVEATDFSDAINAAIDDIKRREGGRDLTIAYLSDGPYAIPYVK